MRTAAGAAHATLGPPVVSIIVTPSLPTPLSAAGARVPGGGPSFATLVLSLLY